MKKRNHAAIRRALALCVERLLSADDLPVKFYAHQREAYEALLIWLRSQNRDHRRYFAHATGMGKSLHFIALAVEALKQQLRSMIVVSNQTLLYQIAREIYRYTKGSVAVGHISSMPVEIRDHEDESILYATKGWQDKSIVLITQDSFRSWASRLAEGFDPHFVVRDEMHWAYTDRQLAAMDMFSEAVVLGYSATPDWLTTTARNHFAPVELDNGTTLYVDPARRADTHFGSCLHRAGLRYGIERGVLAPLAWGEIDLSMISLDDVPVVNTPAGYDYDPKALAAHMAKNWGLVMDVMDRLYATNEYGIRDLPLIAACPTIALAEDFAKVVGKYTGSATVTGADDHRVRAELFGSFDSDTNDDEEDAIRALSSVFVLREGTDLRNATILAFLRATRSRVMYEQFLGRILRKRRDGRPKTALVLDPRYHQTKFAPLNAPMLYGTPGEEVTRGGILIGPKPPRGGKTLVSPYLPKGVQVKIKITPIEIEYWTNEEGMVEIGGEWWAHEFGCVRYIGVSSDVVHARTAKCRSRPGRDSGGHVVTLFAIKDMQKACEVLTAVDTLSADKDGKADDGDDAWCVKQRLPRILGLSMNAIKPRLASCRSRPGKTDQGRAVTLYSLKDLKKACGKLLGSDVSSAKEGMEAISDEWMTAYSYATLDGLDHKEVGARVITCHSKPGLDKRRRPAKLYCLRDMRQACADLLARKSRKQ